MKICVVCVVYKLEIRILEPTVFVEYPRGNLKRVGLSSVFTAAVGDVQDKHSLLNSL
jgi:hypothetical protein